MARPSLAAIVAVLAVAPGVALAQAAAQAAAQTGAQVGAQAGSGQVVSTAPAGPVAPPHQTASGQVASVSDAAPDDSDQDDGPVRDNRVHGEISVGAGTNGYREVSGVATAPIGDVGQATIAVDSSQYNYHR